MEYEQASGLGFTKPKNDVLPLDHWAADTAEQLNGLSPLEASYRALAAAYQRALADKMDANSDASQFLIQAQTKLLVMYLADKWRGSDAKEIATLLNRVADTFAL